MLRRDCIAPLAIAAACAVASGCGKSAFSGGSGKVAKGGGNGGPGEPAGPQDEIDSTSSSDDQLPDQDLGANAPESKPECPQSEQTVLVVDLRSGWWAGDGGDFFHSLLRGLGGPCQATLSFEYHHVTQSLHEYALYAGGSIQDSDQQMTPPAASFARRAFAQYGQVWVLSGSRDDEDDLRIESPAFRSVVDGIVGSEARVFVGGGYGAVYHANAVTAALGLGVTMETVQGEDMIVELDDQPVQAVSQLAVAEGAGGHAVFAGGRSGIADGVRAGGEAMASDSLRGDAKTLGRNDAGAAVLGEAKAAGGRKVLLDAGLQRYYVITDPTAGASTLAMLQNVARYLSVK